MLEQNCSFLLKLGTYMQGLCVARLAAKHYDLALLLFEHRLGAPGRLFEGRKDVATILSQDASMGAARGGLGSWWLLPPSLFTLLFSFCLCWWLEFLSQVFSPHQGPSAPCALAVPQAWLSPTVTFPEPFPLLCPCSLSTVTAPAI